MNILLIQLKRIGDIILTTPVLRYLKSSLPTSRIDFLCEPMGQNILETNPFLDNLIIYKSGRPIQELFAIRDRRYDVVIDFLNNPRTTLLSVVSGARHRVGYKNPGRSIFYNFSLPHPHEPIYASVHKLRLVREWLRKTTSQDRPFERVTPELFLNDDDEAFVRDWERSTNIEGQDFVVLAPFHRHAIRQWRLEGFRDIGRLFSKSGFRVFVSYGPGEDKWGADFVRDSHGQLELLPLTSLRRVAGIFKKSKMVVTNDSGSMHLAVSVGTPTVAIYGPTNPDCLTPPPPGPALKQKHVSVVAESLSCLGCELKKCPVGHLCMTQLSTETVWQACQRLISERL